MKKLPLIALCLTAMNLRAASAPPASDYAPVMQRNDATGNLTTNITVAAGLRETIVGSIYAGSGATVNLQGANVTVTTQAPGTNNNSPASTAFVLANSAGSNPPWSSITGKPTSAAGFGITFGSRLDALAANISNTGNFAFGNLSGVPTTAAGYGIGNGSAIDAFFANSSFGPSFSYNGNMTVVGKSVISVDYTGSTLFSGQTLINPEPGNHQYGELSPSSDLITSSYNGTTQVTISANTFLVGTPQAGLQLYANGPISGFLNSYANHSAILVTQVNSKGFTKYADAYDFDTDTWVFGLGGGIATNTITASSLNGVTLQSYATAGNLTAASPVSFILANVSLSSSGNITIYTPATTLFPAKNLFVLDIVIMTTAISGSTATPPTIIFSAGATTNYVTSASQLTGQAAVGDLFTMVRAQKSHLSKGASGIGGSNPAVPLVMQVLTPASATVTCSVLVTGFVF